MSMVLDAVLFMIWFFVPAGAANMAPVIVKRLNWWQNLDRPIDGGKNFNGKRILGDHKTWRGLLAGWVFALVAATIQFWLYNNYQSVRNFSEVNYSDLNLFWFSTLLALGALGGDAMESFFKRQAGIEPGKSWVPFDQIDWVIGAFVASLLLVELPIIYYVIGVILGLILHPLVNLLGWVLKIKDKPF